ncbi:type II toxin-antitoxin system VapC family toxin [Anabaena azotica]|uniref:Type II toxin-antitoxin system VapC family toxin n=1 Tax=Anabaena azotica FACHB-119 TaxID=947527 RepID=A0ABR8D4M9_9NOST|nr:type II toxin-antitoxin system VapC family toxin [Anabaena azotica]MBD2501416.1 type II toxin-antitoxin system VapC family toxin [Anabaena azotica FACHB-119]
MYLIDTNHCSYLMEGLPSVVEHLRSLGQVELATSVIVAGELRFMAQNSQQITRYHQQELYHHHRNLC